ncbi:MAG: DUF1508 domain-containing protein [Pseudomonadales bacterium]
MPQSSARSTPLPFPLFFPTALHQVPTSLARLGCDSLRHLAARQVEYVQDLGTVSDLRGLMDWQARWTRTLWQDQQRVAQQALRILGLPDGNAPAAGSEPTPATTSRPRRAAEPARQDAVDTTAPAAETGRSVASKTTGSTRTGSRRRRNRAEPRVTRASYELFVDSAGDHRFRLKRADGAVLLISNPYRSRASAVNGIDVVRRNAANDDRYVTAQDDASGPTFDLRAGNSRVISSSTPFASTAQMEAAMAMVKQLAGSARIESG